MLTATLQILSKSLAQRFQHQANSMLKMTLSVVLPPQQQQQQSLVQYPQPALVGLPQPDPSSSLLHWEEAENSVDDFENDAIWFAVPKRKHTRSRKRKKTTVQKRLKVKQNIVFDPRTGEVTLQHRLPFNWKDYLPKIE